MDHAGPSLPRHGLGALQATVALVVLAGVALAPPQQGTMLLVPLRADAADRLAARVVDAGGRLLAPGPIAGSIVVSGSRTRLSALVGAGVLLVNAPAAWCGHAAVDRLA